MNEQLIQQREYSSFWVRFAAAIIDSFVLNLLSIALQILFFVISFFVILPFSGENGEANIIADLISMILAFIFILISFGVPFVYFIYMTYVYQATLGKMAVGIRVEQEDGAKLSLKRIAFRETVGKFVSSIILMIGYIVAAFTRRKQGLHDMMSKTVVVYVDPIKKANKPVVAGVIIVYGAITMLILAFIAFVIVMFALSFSGDEGWMYENEQWLEPQDRIEGTINFS